MLFARLILKIFPDFISKKIKEEYHQYQRDKSTPNWTRNTSYNTSNNIKIGFVAAGNYANHQVNSLMLKKCIENIMDFMNVLILYLLLKDFCVSFYIKNMRDKDNTQNIYKKLYRINI